ncbi:universal stress protein [Bacillus tuaregi]|uniref:universal stress protein n=1 Tax=Bacillus tuaregi TaxID=1816695 RepID=UPI0008F8C528|nr:universal stress protein [Bacillus tuaregi]
MYNRILVAIDGSEQSEKALKSALKFANERYSKVTVMHVKKNITIYETMSSEVVDEMYSEMKKEADKLFNHAKALAEDYGVEIETYYVIGEPSTLIVKMAEEGNYQLIVMGSRGLGGIKGIMLGSVSQRVTQLSHCPVLIVK